MKRRKRIGIMMAFIDRFFQTQLLKGIQTCCDDQDWDLVFFLGRSINSPEPHDIQNNIIYELINTEKIDGLIVTSGILSNYIGTEAFISFMKAYSNIPIISLSIALPGVPSFVIENKASLKCLMEHLIHQHDYKTYAYISGPRTNNEAVERLESYRETLTEHGITVNEALIYEGTHAEQSGARAIHYFIDELKIVPDIIVAGNDDMAMGAYKALNAIGLRVPDDIAITGFDGTERIESFYLPFTTIQQPLFEMGYQSVLTLKKIFSHQPVELITKLTGTLRVGESCGCFGSTLIEKNSSVAARNVDDFIQMAEHIRENNDSIVTFLLNSLGIRMNKSYYSKNISELLLVFAKDLEQQNQNGPFLLHLNRMIQGDVSRMRSTIEWENFLIAIKSYILGRLPSVEIISWLNELLFNAYTFVSRIMVRKERSNDYSTHLLHNATMYLIYLFTNVTTIEGMIDLTRRQVKYWAFKELYICLYDEVALFSENERFKIPEKIHLKFGYQNNQEVSSEIFDVKDMLPSSILKSDERIEVVFQPLFFGFNQFGYIVVDLETSKSVLYIALKEQIANLLERKLLLDQLEAKNNQLQIISRMDALTGLYNRRGFYELSEAAFQEAIENDQRISIIYGDLDGLKGVNDRYGHHEGDSFIRTIANILRASCEDEAIIGRVGGDEFIICQVEDASRTSGFETLERILNQLEKLNRKKKKPYATSISLGISIYDPEKPLIFEELIKVADADLYNQKSKKKHSSI